MITALKDVGPRGKYCLHGGCFPTGKVQATDSNTKSTQYPLAEETMMSVLMQCKYAEEILVQHKSGGKQYKHHCIRKLNAHKHKHRCIYVYAIYSIFCIYISSIYTRTIFFSLSLLFLSSKENRVMDVLRASRGTMALSLLIIRLFHAPSVYETLSRDNDKVPHNDNALVHVGNSFPYGKTIIPGSRCLCLRALP